ncbi:lysine exporter LysO family protein [Ignatzschineria larvae DSM 13226]|uniref:Lysine exporter LysO family protein n=1 Tax=Ignatzschineria larvae DSM 13226 TaxID=1111732 RepID=A0ABZ3BZJ5_9GAMM|nr:lysine exporter LysO family protein [Ignatzschineria larvae]
MLQTLLWVLLPLFLGFAIPLKNRRLIRFVDQALIALIYLVLFIMGLNLSLIPDLWNQLQSIFGKTAVFIIAILGLNMVTLLYLDKLLPFKIKEDRPPQGSTWHSLWGSFKLIGTIILGLIVGLLANQYVKVPEHIAEIAIVILLACVGLQLRASGIKLKAVLFNRYGLILSFFFIISSFLGGIIAALILKMPVVQGLAISSGFGWYSLSTIILQDAHGPIMGSIAFFNDLFREFFAFMIIPLLMARFPLTAVGSGGATSLDFVLPVIQRAGGPQVVPIAISFGFITNLLAPIFLVFFANL